MRLVILSVVPCVCVCVCVCLRLCVHVFDLRRHICITVPDRRMVTMYTVSQKKTAKIVFVVTLSNFHQL